MARSHCAQLQRLYNFKHGACSHFEFSSLLRMLVPCLGAHPSYTWHGLFTDSKARVAEL
jgi:hypothetical protein